MITILMPIYNGIEFIDESIESIKEQSYEKWELIIGINGHEPNSDVYLRAKEYESDKIRIIELYPIKGKANALNEMLKYAQYNWIALLDVDDIWHNDKLLFQNEFTKDYDIIGTGAQYFGNSCGYAPIPYNDLSNFDFLSVNPIINSSCLVRKELCYWDSNYDGVEDYDMWLRLSKLKKRFFNIERILVRHRIHNNSAFNAKGNHLKVAELRNRYNI